VSFDISTYAPYTPTLVAASAALFAGISVLYGARQVKQTKKALESQAFLSILDTARRISLSENLDTIRDMPRYEDFKKFESEGAAEQQEAVRSVVDFFNDLSHLIEHRYVTPRHIVGIYTLSIKACKDKLLPWWLEGFREKYKSDYYYSHFETLCDNVDGLLRGEDVVWPKARSTRKFSMFYNKLHRARKLSGVR